MYTVARFISETRDSEKLLLFGEQLNRIIPDSFDRLHRSGGLFSVSVCEDADWLVHKAEIVSFLERLRPLLKLLKDDQISIEFDVAIWPEDHAGRLYYSVIVDPTLADCLSENAASLVYSYYKTAT